MEHQIRFAAGICRDVRGLSLIHICGNPIRLGRKDIGFKTKDFTKVFLRIKREKSMEELDLQLFKEAFKTIAAEMYDVMEFEKGQKFDDWITNTYKCLPKK